MKIWESQKDWGAIMRKVIILIEIVAIILLLAAIPGKEIEATKEIEVIKEVEIAKEIEAKYFLMTATAYFPGHESCHPFDDGKTATGADAGKGCIAIDPEARILKLGQKVYVEGYGFGECNDVGSAIKGWEIDVCFESYQEAKEWGRKLVKVYVLD